MGKYIMLIVASFIVGGSIYLVRGAGPTAVASDQKAHVEMAQMMAREIALTGLSEGQHYAIANAPAASLAPLSGTYQDGSYDVTFSVDSVSPYRVTIRSVGSIDHTSSDGASQHVVEATYEEGMGSSGVPGFMTYALLADDDFTLNGTVSVEDAGGMQNTNVHTNGALTVNGRPNTVRGFGTYVTSHSGKNPFSPYTNPDGLDVLRQAAPVEIPPFSAADHAARATQVTNGDLVLSGNVVLGGTEDAPAIWYVDGNVSASGTVVVSGYGMIIATGNMNLGGNVTLLHVDPAESPLGLFATGNITIGGNAVVEATLFAQGTIRASGTPRIYGGLLSGADLVLSGTPDIYHRPPSAALGTLFTSAEALSLVSRREWTAGE